jgi:hypothetical protein
LARRGTAPPFTYIRLLHAPENRTPSADTLPDLGDRAALKHQPMRSQPKPRLPFHGALLTLCGAALACSSRYEPEGQFWPNLGPVSLGIGSTAADGGVNEVTGSAGATSGADNSTGGNIELGSGNSVGAGGGSTGAGGSSSSTGAGGSSSSTGPSTGGSSATSGTPPSGGTSSGTCSLSVSVTTTAPGGNYKPRNVGAIWVADASGAFVKSLDVWGNRRLSHVTAWNAATKAAGVPGNKVDAVTSATLTAHRAHNVTWNCEDYNGQVAPDGSYRVYFEVTDSNGSGPNHFETFTKGPTAATVQGSATNFTGIVLTFTP